jgi:hypothetical protein
MQVSLAKPHVIVGGLTMAQAEAALTRARASAAARFLDFHIEATPHVPTGSSAAETWRGRAAPGWCLAATVRGMREAVLRNHAAFVIDIDG